MNWPDGHPPVAAAHGPSEGRRAQAKEHQVAFPNGVSWERTSDATGNASSKST